MTRRGDKKVYIRETSRGRIMEQGRIRLLCISLFFILCFGSISARLVEMMIDSMQRTSSLSLADIMQGNLTPEEAEALAEAPRLTRGDIVDRNGVLLATNLVTASAFANPREISKPDVAAAALARALRMDKQLLRKRLSRNNSFVWIKRHLTPREQKEVNSIGIPGVYFLPEEKRVYPYGNMFSHVLGYVGVDNKGLSGIEKQYNHRLMDGERNEPLALSLDMRVQHILRDETQKAMDKFNAIGAAGIVMDVNSGEIIALSSLPDFDPNDPASASDQKRFNRATLGVYEMGSTFKSFTMAMALDTGNITPQSGYDASQPFRLANFTVSDYHGKNRWLSVPEIFVYSSNIGTARMLLDVGIGKQKAFMEKLGMMKAVNLDLPEVASPLLPAKWQEVEAVTISYGHGISVTPLHLVRGIAALVNGGTLLTPTLVKPEESERKMRKSRVVSERTSEMMRDMFRLVVTHGTGGNANAKGYRVGGKTGTAEKVLANGRYSKNTNISSFIGVFPTDQPRYVVYVMVDEPKGNKASYGYATGGWVAAPAVGNIVSRMATLVGVEPVFDPAVDGSEQYWVETDKKTRIMQANSKPASPKYLHAVSY